jgi:ABC-type sugar transport system, periplasmic component
MNKTKQKERKILSIVIIMILLVVAVVITMMIMSSQGSKRQEENSSKTKEYKYHVAMIVTSPSDAFWESVYQAARDAGAKEDIYIESFGKELNKEYQETDLMKMAIAANVDGIIIEPNDVEAVEGLIHDAAMLEPSIPVMTIGRDVAGSERVSFVSANDYAIGEKYGGEIVRLLGKENKKISVLFPASHETTQPNLLYSGINEMVEARGRESVVSSLSTGERGAFESEENIRNLLLLPDDKRPDILVCLSVTDTISAYQCVIDYNLVGDVEIIGSYMAPQILDGIQKGIIRSSIVTDAGEMGEMAALGMAEYLNTKYVNEYFMVPSELLTRDNVDKYRDEDEK